MKKALSLILAIMMVFALSTTAFALTNTERVVGFTGQTPAINNGVSNITNNPPSTTLSITANAGDLQHRYAVDIEYDNLTFQISGSTLVWDVNDLEYVQVDANVAPLSNTAFKLKVTNRSDLPVNLETAITDKVGSNVDGLNLALYEKYVDVNDDGEVTFNAAAATALVASKRIEKAQVGLAEEFEFSLVATADNWTDVTNYYMNAISASGISKTTVANLSITFSAAS